MGLFTGVSFLTLFEALVWAARAVAAALMMKRVRKGENWKARKNADRRNSA